MSQQTTTKTQNQAYRNFIYSLRSDATKEDYSKSLGYFMEYLHITEYDALIPENVKVIQSNIIEYLIYCKETRKLSPASIQAYLAAIKRFYDMTVAKHRDIPLFESYYRPDRFKVYKGLPNLKCIFCGKCSQIPFDMDIHLFIDHRDELFDGINNLVKSMQMEAIMNRRYFGCEDEGA